MDLQSTMGTMGQVAKNAFKGMSDEMQMCIQNCMLCYQTCTQLTTYCLQKGGAHASNKHIQTLMDCAAACAMSADFMIRDSSFHTRTCALCAEACLACAESCEAFGDDETMKMCADVCRRCADSCQKMAAQH